MELDISEPGKRPSIFLPALLSLVFVVLLVTLLILTGRLEEGVPLHFLARFKQYIVGAEIVIFGILIVESVSKCIYALSLRRVSADIAAALRIITRIIAYGVILSIVVSIFTQNAAAALTLGSFAGLVAGFASQTVISNAVAGVFMALSRPVHIGDRVTIGANSGVVIAITLMHMVLDVEDREIMIPSSTTVSSVLVRHKQV